MTLSLATAALNAEADATCALLNGGTMEIRTGSPPGPNNVATGTLLATLTFGSPAFGGASAGIATANAITPGSVVATGTAGYFRTKESGGAAVFEGTTTTSGGGGDAILDTLDLKAGTDSSCTSMTYQRT